MLSAPPGSHMQQPPGVVHDQQAASTSQQSVIPSNVPPQQHQQYYQYRQNAAANNYPRPPSRVNQVRMYDQTQNWRYNHYMDEQQYQRGYNQSPAPSVMSNVTHMSVNDDALSMVSTQSHMSTLGPANNQRYTELQRSGMASTPSASCNENINPAHLQEINSRVHEIVTYFNEPSCHQKVVSSIYRMSESGLMIYADREKLSELLQRIRDCLLQPQIDHRIINALLGSIYYITKDDSCLRLFVKINRISNDFVLLRKLAEWMLMNKWAFYIFHNLIEHNSPEGMFCRSNTVRNGQALVHLSKMLLSPNFADSTKLVCHCLRILIRKNDWGKKLLVENRLIENTMMFLGSDQKYNDITVHATLTLLVALVSGEEKSFSEKCVELDVMQAAAVRISNAPVELVREGLKLMQYISDVRCQNNCEVPMDLALHYLNCNDTELRSHAAGFLANIIANQPRNKEFLIRKGAFQTLTDVAKFFSRREMFSEKQMGLVEEVIDSVYMCLSSLITHKQLDAEMLSKRDAVLCQDDFCRSVLNHLREGSLQLKSRVLRLASILLTHITLWKQRVLVMFDDYSKDNIIAIMFAVLSQYKTPLPNDLDKSRQVTLLTRLFSLLNTIVKECNEEVRDAVINLTRHTVSLFDIIRTYSVYNNADELTKNILSFCCALCGDQELQTKWSNDSTYLETLCSSTNCEISSIATTLMEELRLHLHDFDGLFNPYIMEI